MQLSSRPMRRAGALAAAAVLTAGAAPAFAESRGRIYAGSTSTGDPIVLQLSNDGKHVTRVIEMWNAECTAGGTFPLGGSLKSNIAISRTGAFKSGRETTAPFGDQTVSLDETVKGTVSGRTLKGSTVAAMTFYDQAGTLVDTCASKFTFKAVSAPGRVYGGATSQDMPAVIELSSNRRKVKNAFIGWQATCSNEAFIQIGERLQDFDISGGRFGDSFADDNTFDDGGTGHLVYDFEGRKTDAKASGTLRVQYTRSDAAGAVTGTCDTRKFRWSATSG